MPPKLIVEVVGDTSRLERSFKQAGGAAKGLGASFGSLSVGFGQLVKGVIVVDAVQKAFQGLHTTVHLGIAEFSEHAKVSSQTESALKSTGGIANVTAKQIDALGLSLSNLSGVDDEVVQSGANVLLGFQNIRDFAGKNNDIFTQATKATVDFAVRSGRSVPAAAVAIGRALQDPAKAAGSLRRAYVVLTASEKSAIASAVKHGDILKAQQLIIADLNKRYGGAAEALGKTLPGQINVLRDRFKDLAGELVGAVVPATTRAVTGLTSFVKTLSETQGFDAKIKLTFDTIGDVGKALAVKVRKQINSINWGSIPARIGLAVTTIGDAGKQIFESVRTQVAAIDWKPIFEAAKGIGEGFQVQFERIDWSKVGKTIGDGIAKGVADATGIIKPLAEKLDAAFRTAFASIDFNKFGRASGPGLAAALVSAIATLLDPSFWLKNWDLALAIAATAFGDGLGRVASKFIAPFTRLAGRFAPALARLGQDIALRLLTAVERVAPRVASAFLDIGIRGAQLLGRGLGSLVGLADRVLAAAIGPFVRFFRRTSGLLRFTIKVLGIQAVIDEIARAFTNIAHTIEHALDGAFNGLKEKALKAVLDIIEPFTHLPKALGGGPFQAMKAELQAQLDGMVSNSQTAAAKMQAAFDSVNPPGLTGPATAENQAGPARAVLQRPALTTAGSSLPEPPAPTAQRKGLTAAQRNTFFDNAISSDLTRAGFLTNIKAQIGALQRIAGLISSRIAATKDITRRRTLEDQLLSVQSQIKGDQQQVAQNFLSSLQFGITKAQATATFKDDIAAFEALEKGIRAQIKATGDTQDLEQQLLDARQGLAAARVSARNALQFKSLGLTATGDAVTPGIKRLKNELAALTTAITGTFLDTSKTQSVISNIRKVLSGSLGAVGQEVRSKIQGILDDLKNQLKNATGNLTKFSKTNANAIIAGLGLSPEQARVIRAKLSQIGVGGSVHGTGSGAFGFALPAGAGAGGGDIVVHTSVNLDGKKVATSTTKHQQTARRRNPVQKRGPNAGGI